MTLSCFSYRAAKRHPYVHVTLLDLGIIAVVIFTILCTLVFLIRYMIRHKRTHHTSESKEDEHSESTDTAMIGTEPNFTETIDESKKEWFI